MNIGLDFDGVIVDFGLLKSFVAAKMFKIHIPPHKLFRKTITKEHLLTDDQYSELQMEALHNPKYLHLLRPIPGSLKAIKYLLSQRHVVRVVTARYDNSLKNAQSYLSNVGLNIKIVGARTIPDKISATGGMDVFMDDFVENLLPLYNTVNYLYLFPRHHNIHDKLPKPIVRVTGWIDFLKTISVLAKTQNYR